MTIKECEKNPVRIGDFVTVTRGGSSESKKLIWLVVGRVTKFCGKPIVKIRLVDGTFVKYGVEYEVGYERDIHMTSVKKIDVVVKEKVV